MHDGRCPLCSEEYARVLTMDRKQYVAWLVAKNEKMCATEPSLKGVCRTLPGRGAQMRTNENENDVPAAPRIADLLAKRAGDGGSQLERFLRKRNQKSTDAAAQCRDLMLEQMRERHAREFGGR